LGWAEAEAGKLGGPKRPISPPAGVYIDKAEPPLRRSNWMSTSLMLQDKRAVVFGGGGSIGAAVARELASEGADVFLAGRTSTGVEAVAKEITAAGGRAHADVIDALDAAAVNEYLESIVQQTGSLDIEFNATGPRVSEYGNGKPAVELPIEEFMMPVDTVLKSQFVTARAAARHMLKQGSGVIIFLTGSPARPHGPGTSGIGAAFGAVENLMRTMAIELGPAGVRVVCLRTAANPDTRTIQETTDVVSKMMNITRDQANASLAESTMLKVSPRTTDTARAAAFLASDQARMMTGTVLNSSAGAVTD
jgi:NAD(P)-dependent dehydrogenase (short-subunit alcohol dehydrogenase family)